MNKVPAPYQNGTAHKILQVFSWILTIAAACCFAFLIWHMARTQMFSNTQLILAGIIAAIVTLLLGWVMIGCKNHLVWRAVCMILAVCLSTAGIVGGRYLQMTSEALDFIGGESGSENGQDNSEILNEADLLTSKMAVTVSTYAMQTSGITKPSDLNGQTIGIASSLDEKGTKGALEQLEKSGASFKTVEYSDIYSLTDALFNDEVSAVVFPELYHDDLLEAANEDRKSVV